MLLSLLPSTRHCQCQARSSSSCTIGVHTVFATRCAHPAEISRRRLQPSGVESKAPQVLLKHTLWAGVDKRIETFTQLQTSEKVGRPQNPSWPEVRNYDPTTKAGAGAAAAAVGAQTGQAAPHHAAISSSFWGFCFCSCSCSYCCCALRCCCRCCFFSSSPCCSTRRDPFSWTCCCLSSSCSFLSWASPCRSCENAVKPSSSQLRVPSPVPNAEGLIQR